MLIMHARYAEFSSVNETVYQALNLMCCLTLFPHTDTLSEASAADEFWRLCDIGTLLMMSNVSNLLHTLQLYSKNCSFIYKKLPRSDTDLSYQG